MLRKFVFCASVKAGNSEKNERKKDKGKSTFKSDRITVEGEKGGFTFPSIGYEDWIVEGFLDGSNLI